MNKNYPFGKTYHIRHFGKGDDRENEFYIYYGEEVVLGLRAKSRSKKETQRLLDHVNNTILLRIEVNNDIKS